MAGKVLRCDHDGCDAVFPPAPVRGYHWPVRKEAEKAGWTSTRRGMFNVDHDSDHTIRDFCPEHVADVEPLVPHRPDPTVVTYTNGIGTPIPQPGQPTMNLVHPESRRVIDGLRWLLRRR